MTYNKARVRDALIFSFQASANLDSLEASRLANHATFRQEGGVNFILLINSSVRTPELDVRAYAKFVAQDVRENLRSQALIILGDGFGAAMHRAFMSSFVLAQRPARPSRVFGDWYSALKWQQ